MPPKPDFSGDWTLNVAASTLRPSNWDGDTLDFTNTTETPSGSLTISFRYQLEEQGRRLRATERLRGAGREQDNVWVFDLR